RRTDLPCRRHGRRVAGARPRRDRDRPRRVGAGRPRPGARGRREDHRRLLADRAALVLEHMSSTRDFLRSFGLPGGDLNELPDSPKRFPDDAQYRVEIPSTEGPRCLDAVLEEAERLGVRVHRVSQGSGVFLHTDAELDELARTAASARVEMSLFTRPNAAWGT